MKNQTQAIDLVVSKEISIEMIIDDILTDYAYANSKGKLVEAREHLFVFIRLMSSPLSFQKESSKDSKSIEKGMKKLKLVKDELRYLNHVISVEHQ